MISFTLLLLNYPMTVSYVKNVRFEAFSVYFVNKARQLHQTIGLAI